QPIAQSLRFSPPFVQLAFTDAHSRSSFRLQEFRRRQMNNMIIRQSTRRMIHRGGAEDAEESRREGERSPLHSPLYSSSSLSARPPRPLRLRGESESYKRSIGFITAACLIAVCLIVVSICLPAPRATAQSGALIPVSVKNEPDSSILSLQVMKVDVV